MRLLVDGKVSWDHFMEEFQRHKDLDIVEVMELVESMSRKHGKYSNPKNMNEEDKKMMETIINKLEGAG